MAKIPEKLNLPDVADYPVIKRELTRSWLNMAQLVNNLFTLYYQDDEPVIPDNAMSMWTDSNGDPNYYLVGNFGGTIKAVELGSGVIQSHLHSKLFASDGSPEAVTVDAAGDVTFAGNITLTDTVWDDVRINPGSFDRPGISDPTPVVYYPNGGGLGMYLYQFGKNQFVSFTVQIPHSYKQGTDVMVHLHWTPGANGAAESGNTVGWKVDYSWANINGAFTDMQTCDLSDACDGTDHKHQMTPEVTIDGHTAEKHISSMLLCNLRRSDTGADDTWAGTASGALPMILEVDFHFEMDTIGSRTISLK